MRNFVSQWVISYQSGQLFLRLLWMRMRSSSRSVLQSDIIFLLWKRCSKKKYQKQRTNFIIRWWLQLQPNFQYELGQWCKLWRSTLAPKKCNYIFFSRTNKFEIDLKLNGESTPKCGFVKYLGITLDERLNFNEYITNLRVACTDRISALKIISHKSSQNNLSLKRLFKEFIAQ